MKSKSTKTLPSEPVEWDLKESLGIIPQEISLNHNLGCVRSPKNATIESSNNQHIETDSKKPKDN
jgi:hypothetical protein